MSGDKFKLGDEVVVNHFKAYKSTIAKVGRKYVYVEGDWRNTPFNKYDGREANTDYTAGRLYTAAEWAEKQRRAELIEALRTHGVRFLREDVITTDLLAALLAVFTEGDESLAARLVAAEQKNVLLQDRLDEWLS